MTLPGDFQFSQGSLQDYVDCPRRFYLRYIRRLAWPAVVSEPIAEQEARGYAGQAFHRLVRQHLLGIVGVELAEGATLIVGDALSRWWRNYLQSPPADLPAARYPEIGLSAALAGHRLVAQYDLIAVEPGKRAVIVDWKTTQRRPAPGWLAKRLQTRVYRYLLARAGRHLNGGQEIAPEQITMIYWFAEFPQEPASFSYDNDQYAADEAYLARLIAEIARGEEADFPLTPAVERCGFCLYRSLCARGVKAAAGDEEAFDAEDATLVEGAFDFEQIAEIAF